MTEDKRTPITHNLIMAVLRDEAVDVPHEGWLSDNEDVKLDPYDPNVLEIHTYNGDTAHVDLSHLASIVQRLIEENR